MKCFHVDSRKSLKIQKDKIIQFFEFWYAWKQILFSKTVDEEVGTVYNQLCHYLRLQDGDFGSLVKAGLHRMMKKDWQ